jgi:LysM repeat protein
LRENPGATKKQTSKKIINNKMLNNMNTTNPLLPQGTLPPPGRSSLYFKILIVFAFHIVLLGGILMVGCKDTSRSSAPPKDAVVDSTPMSPTSPDAYPAPPTPVSIPLPPAPLPQTPSSTTPAITGNSTTIPSGPQPALPPTPATTAHEATDYVIAPGDTFGALSKKFNVSLKAIEDANPGVDPKKLQPKQTVHIPAATAVASTPSTRTAVTDTAASASGDTTTYVIKPGDMLTKIAKAHGTTVNALKALNNMKTSEIIAGRTLKVPVIKVASVDSGPASPAAPVIPATPATPATTVRAN